MFDIHIVLFVAGILLVFATGDIVLFLWPRLIVPLCKRFTPLRMEDRAGFDVNRPLVAAAEKLRSGEPVTVPGPDELRRAALEEIASRENMQELLAAIKAEATRLYPRESTIRIELASNLTEKEVEAVRLRLRDWTVSYYARGRVIKFPPQLVLHAPCGGRHGR